MIIEKTGDIFTSTQPAIGHGVNCFGVMGSGIAVEFKRRYPGMFEQYQQKCKTLALNPGHVFSYYDEKTKTWIFNIASQYAPGPEAKMYYLSTALYDMKQDMNYYGVSGVALPRIGCGIGGLRWEDVLKEIKSKFEDSPLVCEVWTFQ